MSATDYDAIKFWDGMVKAGLVIPSGPVGVQGIFGRSAARNAPPRRGSATSPYSSETRTDSADGSLEAEFWASLRKEVRR